MAKKMIGVIFLIMTMFAVGIAEPEGSVQTWGPLFCADLYYKCYVFHDHDHVYYCME